MGSAASSAGANVSAEEARKRLAIPEGFDLLPQEHKKYYEDEFKKLIADGETPVQAVQRLKARGLATHETNQLLAEADVDNDGALTAEEIALAKIKQGATEAEAVKAAKEVLTRVDWNGDGVATQEELIEAGTKKWLDAFYQKLAKAFFAEFESLKRAFAAADKNGGGTLCCAEFGQLMRTAGGIDITDDEVAAAFAVADEDGDGLVNWVEFMRCVQEDDAPENAHAILKLRSSSISSPESIALLIRRRVTARFRDVQHAFKELDPDQSGTISTDELQELLKNRWNVGLPQEDVNRFVASYRHKESGGFSYVEFCRMIRGKQPFKDLESVEENSEETSEEIPVTEEVANQ